MAGCPLTAQRGALTVRENIAELVSEAATVVRGRVTSARVEQHPTLKNLKTIVVTVKVSDTLKGNPGSTFSFRQFIWDIRDTFNRAGYRKGEEVLLLVTRPSRYGLSSPVGMEQGRFHILRDREGNQYAVNGHGNVGLFDGIGIHLEKARVQMEASLIEMMDTHRAGPVKLDQLEDLIRTLAGED